MDDIVELEALTSWGDEVSLPCPEASLPGVEEAHVVKNRTVCGCCGHLQYVARTTEEF
jgi:hypothetical protein